MRLQYILHYIIIYVLIQIDAITKLKSFFFFFIMMF
uniref:Uncharacterized protein n=1 Tax=Manihot esculenta TaxID=3983 RepID=A0A2C9V7A2_MANES